MNVRTVVRIVNSAALDIFIRFLITSLYRTCGSVANFGTIVV